jgi:DNA-binding NtrC family response regulator
LLKALIVEDQPAVAKALTVLLEINDLPCAHVADPRTALDHIDAGDVGVVIQDMNFSPGATSGDEGMALFREIKRRDPDLPVLVITAWTSLEAAVQMVKEGASDYLAKPWDDAKLLTTVRNLLRLRELQMENQRLRSDAVASRQELAARHDLCGVVYASAAMHRVVSLAVQVASADVPVLITGPNGAGKEKIAEIVQANSPRRDAPFVRVNAGALPDELLESELFGAEAGAYTGATKRRVGRFEAAHLGTLFLDEIGNLSPAGQMKLLRVLQSGAFERLGSSETRRVDVRVLAATNVDLRAALVAGRFREDLFFRLNVIELAVPPLRHRPDDILPLAASFLRAFGAGGAGVPRTLAPDAQAALLAHTWPGNVRELRNRIQRATLISGAQNLSAQDLELSEGGSPGPAAASAGDPETTGERRLVEEALVAAQGRVSTAAARLGVSRQALYRRMERLGIVLERRPKS